MIPWEPLESAAVPGGTGALELLRRGGEFSIRTSGCELMNSRVHGSEEALARGACADLGQEARVLIGGLGMGYTLRAALDCLDDTARVTVAELVPAVVTWNRGVLAPLAGRPLDDPRVTARERDVAELLRESRDVWDAVILDVDNGPEGLTDSGNDWLYGYSGLKTIRSALAPGGVLAVWSSGDDDAFTRRFKGAGFAVEVTHPRARGAGRGGRHTVWLGRR